MKLKNKKTGGLANLIVDKDLLRVKTDAGWQDYNSLVELTEDWEDYEEPKGSALDLTILTLTNFIENEPDEDKVDLNDCKQLLKKLKAWQRLKDKITAIDRASIGEVGTATLFIRYKSKDHKEVQGLLTLLLGGEE